MSSNPVLEVRGLYAAYQSEPVLRAVNLDVGAGTITAVIGPNGAGKSTLLKALLGILKPLAGSVEFFGKSLAQARQDVAYVPQLADLDWDFPATVQDVALMGTYPRLGWWRKVSQQERQQAATALEQTGMGEHGRKPVGELSGGQRQRTLLARALAQQPRMLLMDEPFQGVDVVSQRAITDVLQGLKSQQVSTLLVHHDLPSVADFADQVILLNKTVYASGSPAQVLTPSHLAAAYQADAEQLERWAPDGNRTAP